MWFIIWVSALGLPAERIAVFKTEELCQYEAAVLNMDKPSWGEYICFEEGAT